MRVASIVLLAVTLAGCAGGEPAGRQVGAWCLDYESMPEYAEVMRSIGDLPERQRRIRATIARAEADLTIVEFTKDTIIVQMIIGQRALPYRVVSSTVDDVVLEAMEGNQKKTLTLTMQGNDAMITDLGMASGKQLRFTRLY